FRRCRRGAGWRWFPVQLSNGVQQTAAMPNQRHANIPQVVGGQGRQDLCVDGVVTKCVGILLEPQLAQPLKDFDRLPFAIGCHRSLFHWIGAAAATPERDASLWIIRQLPAIGYFARISPIRLSAFSVAACGVIPSRMMSASATPQTCWAITSAKPGLR